MIPRRSEHPWTIEELDALLPPLPKRHQGPAAGTAAPAAVADDDPRFSAELREMLAEPADARTDRSAAAWQFVCECRRLRLDEGEMIGFLLRYAPAVAKYGPRTADEGRRMWAKLGVANEDGELDEPPPEPTHQELDGEEEPAEEASEDEAGQDDDNAEGAKTTKPKAKSQATQLVRAARSRYRLGRTPEDEPFAIPHSGANIAYPLNGRRSFRGELSKYYYGLTGAAPSGAALTDALSVLEGFAYQAPPEPVGVRVAPYEEGVVVDLGDELGRAVLIMPGSWDVIARSPVPFRRSKAMSPMPVPVGPGDLEALRDLLNLTAKKRGNDEAGYEADRKARDDDWQLIVGWLVGAVLPDISHPVLDLGGEQGTGKSMAARLSCALVDPSPAQVRRPPSDPKDFIAQCRASWVVCFDNLSSIPPWLSNALCRATSGDGDVSRALFTDADVSVVSYKRVLAMTSIDKGHVHGDLSERLLPIDFEPIGDDERQEEAEIYRLFDERRPVILAGLFDLVADVLERRPSVRPSRLPRMADFARVLATIDELKGWATLAAYRARVARAMQAVVDDDLVGQALMNFVARLSATISDTGELVQSWQGPMGQLLGALPVPDPRPKDWPRTVQAFTATMTRLTPALRAKGLRVERGDRAKHQRSITIARPVRETDAEAPKEADEGA